MRGGTKMERFGQAGRSGVITAGGMLWLVAVAMAVPGAANSPGRYSMSPADGGGFVRLDTQTGTMSLCQRRDADWTCREMAEPGQGLGEEVERLRTENQRLKAEIRQMEEIIVGDKRAEAGRGDKPGLTFKLPSEEDVDQAMSYVQRMLKKFREKLKELEGDGKGMPL